MKFARKRKPLLMLRHKIPHTVWLTYTCSYSTRTVLEFNVEAKVCRMKQAKYSLRLLFVLLEYFWFVRKISNHCVEPQRLRTRPTLAEPNLQLIRKHVYESKETWILTNIFVFKKLDGKDFGLVGFFYVILLKNCQVKLCCMTINIRLCLLDFTNVWLLLFFNDS